MKSRGNIRGMGSLIQLAARQAAFAAVFGLLFLGFPPAGPPSALAAEARSCTQEEREDADRRLWLSKADKQRAIERHLPWGVPQPTAPVTNESLLIHRDYVINYGYDLLVPIWTAHKLDAKGLGKLERVNCFRRDPRINAPTASILADYKEPIFDQGHLSPNGDMSRSLYPVVNSFVLSNMTPQYCQFNRGVWQILESLVRLWVKERKTVYVITGSVFDWDGDGRRDDITAAKRMKSNNGKTRVAVPSHFYKILLHKAGDGSIESLAVLMPNDQTDLDGDKAVPYITKHIRSIDEIAAITGLNFLTKLAAEEPTTAAALGKTRATSLWSFTGTPARSLVNADCRKTAGHKF